MKVPCLPQTEANMNWIGQQIWAYAQLDKTHWKIFIPGDEILGVLVILVTSGSDCQPLKLFWTKVHWQKAFKIRGQWLKIILGKVLVHYKDQFSSWNHNIGKKSQSQNLTMPESIFKLIWATDLYIGIDRKLEPARLPSWLDVFQQLVPPLCICVYTGDSQAETVSIQQAFLWRSITLTVAGHENGEHRILSFIII